MHPIAAALMLATGLALLGAIVLLVRLPRYNAGRQCLRCGYARHGLPAAAVCPECGHEHDRVSPALPTYIQRLACATIVSAPLSVVGVCVISLITGIDVPGLIFLALFFAGPLVGLGVLIAAAPLHRVQVVVLAACAMTPPAAGMLLAALDAFVWHPDAQSGVVVIMFPMIAALLACWGLLLGAAILHLLERLRGAPATPSTPATP